MHGRRHNPEEIQQMYIMTSFHTAVEEKLEDSSDGSPVSGHACSQYTGMIFSRWWEVIDRTTGEDRRQQIDWSYDEESGNVVIQPCEAVPRIYSKFSCIYHVGSGTYVQCGGQ